jgi:hypothetical protein
LPESTDPRRRLESVDPGHGVAYDRLVSDDLDNLSDRQRARVRARDRKRTPPRVVVDNPGLKKLALHLAEKRRAASSRPRR